MRPREVPLPGPGGNLRVCGSPGSGKTTVLHALAAAARRAGRQVVVFSATGSEWSGEQVLLAAQLPGSVACAGAVVLVDSPGDVAELGSLAADPTVTLAWTEAETAPGAVLVPPDGVDEPLMVDTLVTSRVGRGAVTVTTLVGSETTDAYLRLAIEQLAALLEEHDLEQMRHASERSRQLQARLALTRPVPDDGYVDPVAVERVMHGDGRVRLTRRERYVALEELARRGVPDPVIATRVGLSPRTVLRHRRRAGIPAGGRLAAREAS